MKREVCFFIFLYIGLLDLSLVSELFILFIRSRLVMQDDIEYEQCSDLRTSGNIITLASS